MNITDLTVPGVWRYPKCQFTQHNRTLSPGGISADARPELRPCPNDGRDMLPLTWREHAQLSAVQATRPPEDEDGEEWKEGASV